MHFSQSNLLFKQQLLQRIPPVDRKETIEGQTSLLRHSQMT